ncbi:MAG: patatin family protein [Bacteroidota bacterium]|nr:patatin family protein [Bacteroidota bacterium]
MNPKPPYDTLILEGGSLRCAFTAGVMDALLLLGPLKFDRIYGISAGSMVMATYLSGQYKHFYRISRDLVEDGTFIRFSSAWSKEGLMNLSHLRAHVMRHAPLDLDALGVAQETTQAIVVTTHLETGEPRYIEPQGRDWMDALVASSSLPMVTRGKVKFRGEWMFDGGYSDPLPLDKALDMGGRHILVVRTRPMGDHASQSYVDSFGMYWHRHNKVLAPLFLEGYERYNDTVDRLLRGGDNHGRTWEEIAPPYPLQTDAWTVGAKEVAQDYRLGVDTAMNWWAHRHL